MSSDAQHSDGEPSHGEQEEEGVGGFRLTTQMPVALGDGGGGSDADTLDNVVEEGRGHAGSSASNAEDGEAGQAAPGATPTRRVGCMTTCTTPYSPGRASR